VWPEILATIVEQTSVSDLDQLPFTAEDACNMIDVCPHCIGKTLRPGQTRLEQANEFAAMQWAAREEMT
jgi:hypothetical protein